ncbi:hypothetical protein PVMG_05769 [Plasmodium vivax Mauritania I]|uniref:Fam-m protein n=1 Tax=Plasmodium vivax Mauritania I TaxID=1035515 RepID=A0A0J9W3V5_PLAVI|nr:hypothetical protein PVMG_05769 [Plasmodium vivax Mauritania I]
MKIMKLLFFLNITTIVLLNWMYNSSTDMFYAHNFLDDYYSNNKTFHIITHRLLAKDKLDLEVTKTIHKNDEDYFSVRNNKQISIYDHLKNDKSNKFEAYKKSLNYRYSKKKGIEKFDCYCERKIFKGIEKIDKLAEGISNKKKLKRIIYKKYMLRIILSSIFSVLGLLITLLSKISSGDATTGGGTSSVLESINIPYSAICVALVFIYISGIIIFLSSIYMLTKIIKYDEIKNGNV